MVRPTPAAIVLGLGTLVTHGFGLSLVPALLPNIAEDTASRYDTLGYAISAGLLGYAAGAWSASAISARFPVRSLLLATYAVCGAGLAATSVIESALELAPAVAAMGFAASVSWTTTVHVISVTVTKDARSTVMTAASSGAALGVLINGVLIQTTAVLHTWRTAFVMAAVVGLVPVAGVLIWIRTSVDRPVDQIVTGFSSVLRSASGRLVAFASLAAGSVVLPYSAFLTATAMDGLGASATEAAALWWLVGILGVVISPLIGRMSDATTPVHGLLLGSGGFAIGLVALGVGWSYGWLVIATVGFALMNYPVWGLTGAKASTDLSPPMAVRSVSLGLVFAAVGGSAVNAVVARWMGVTGTFRSPALALAALLAAVSAWYVRQLARSAPRPP